jgi:drug/metabolite transporter (DMT)-like permease
MLRDASERSASAVLFVAAAFWGLYWWPLRYLEGMGFGATWSVAFFNALPVLVTAPYVVLRWREQGQNLRATALIGLAMGIGLGCYASGLVMSSVIRATMLFYLTPIWSTLIGVLWLGEKLTGGRIVAIVAGLGGLWMLLSGAEGTTVPLNLGDAFSLVAGMLWGVGAALIKKYPDAPTTIASVWQFLFACLFCAGASIFLFAEAPPRFSAVVAGLPVAMAGSILVLLPSLYAIFWASKRLFPGRVGILMMSEAVVAILSASLLLPDETMSLRQWIGSAVILIACLVEVVTKDEGMTSRTA